MRPLTYILGAVAGFFKSGMLEENSYDSEKFKELVLEMYRGFPNTFFSEKTIKETIRTEHVFNTLLKDGFFIKESTIDMKNKKTNYYSLGTHALPLVSSWMNERLSYLVLIMTCVLIVLTVIIILITFL